MFDIKKPSEINIPEFDSIEKKESTMSRQDVMDAVSYDYTALYGQIRETEEEFIYTRLAGYIDQKFETKISKKELYDAITLVRAYKDTYGSTNKLSTDAEYVRKYNAAFLRGYNSGYRSGYRSANRAMMDLLTKKGPLY